MEAGTAFSLSFPDPSATASSHLFSDGSCPTHSFLHRPSINLVLTFWTTPLGTWSSPTSNINHQFQWNSLPADKSSNSPWKVPAKLK